MDSEARPSSALRSPATPLSGADYEVFLNFRSVDTRHTFTDFLYTYLSDAGVLTFRDNNELLRKGEEISPELHKAITNSKISIPILSKNYASSKWCLMELTQMVECKRSMGQFIFPVFYHVKPADVRRQSGSYEEAFIEHMKKYDERKVMEWKEALTEVASLSGWEVKEADGHEGELIRRIVQRVSLDLKKNYLFLSEKLIGIDHHENEIMTLLNARSNDVRIVGICGMSGIGKTTIAKFIYNKLAHSFDCCSFLADIRETTQQPGGLVHLQKQLLADVMSVHVEISNVNRGNHMIRDRFMRKKVLLVLDDVTETFQFDGLVGNHNWFGSGSTIIVTTRNKLVLYALKVNGIYEPPFMDPEQALQLFSMHAFRRKFPPAEYDSISREIVSIAAGLPRTLEVIGSILSQFDNIIIWKETLDKMKKIPANEVQKTLMISYEALTFEQKQIFLDIACLFVGMDKTYLFYMWTACGYHPEIEIDMLSLMSLVIMRDDNVLRMHNQLRDLGRDIVRQENTINPERRSRLWDHEEAFHILEQRRGKKEIEALSLDFELGSQHCFTNEEFVKLRNLRYLKVDGVELVGDFKHLLPQLRWLNWRGCPAHFRPTNFYLKNLVILVLSHSDITEDWEGWSQMKMANKLKVLELPSCALRRTPNFSTYVSLEILILRGCVSLIEIDPSIGNLRNLKVLNISGTHIRNLPDEIRELEKLEVIDVTNCRYLKRDCLDYISSRGPSSLRFSSSSGSSHPFKRFA